MSTKHKEIVRQSNILTTSAYSLTRNAKRLLYMSLNKLSEKEQLTFNKAKNGYEVVISHPEFSELFNVESNSSRDIYRSASDMLESSIITYRPEKNGADGEKALTKSVWITSFDHDPQDNQTVLYYNPSIVDMIPYKKGDPFTQYLLYHASAINNPYAMRLYESICQWRASRTKIKFEIEWMINRFEMPKSYNRLSDFRVRFLKVALEEINGNTDIEIVEVNELCEGTRKNKVTHIEFIWREREKLTTVESKKRPEGLDLAIITWGDVYYGHKLPTLKEIANMKNHFIDLATNGYELSGDFMSAVAKLEKELAMEDA